MSRRFTKYLVRSIVIIAVLFAAYLYSRLSIITLVNGTDKPVSNITVQIAREIWWHGSLSPREAKIILGTIDGSGGFGIELDVEGGRLKKECGNYYFMSFYPVIGTATLADEQLLFNIYERPTLPSFSSDTYVGACALRLDSSDKPEGPHIP